MFNIPILMCIRSVAFFHYFFYAITHKHYVYILAQRCVHPVAFLELEQQWAVRSDKLNYVKVNG